MKVKNFYSPNFDEKKRLKKSIKTIVIHYTGMQSERESLERLCDIKSKVSAHILIGQNGQVFRLVEDNRIAWHAGKSCWGKYKNLNKNSIGIELVNKGHKLGYTSFKKKQISSLLKICKNLIKKYKIKRENIIGHSDIAPSRKIDPGEKFPWEKLAKNGVGTWHRCNSKLLKNYINKKNFQVKNKFSFISNLKKIGYSFPNQNSFLFIKILKAFQRHYRQELVNGILDKECLFIAENLSENL